MMTDSICIWRRAMVRARAADYNISVKDLYLTEHTIVFETQISGPTEGEDVSRRETTPYIVVKTEILDGQVVFP